MVGHQLYLCPGNRLPSRPGVSDRLYQRNSEHCEAFDRRATPPTVIRLSKRTGPFALSSQTRDCSPANSLCFRFFRAPAESDQALLRVTEWRLQQRRYKGLTRARSARTGDGKDENATKAFDAALLYGLSATRWVADLLTSSPPIGRIHPVASSALTFWICEACFFRVAAKTSMPFCCCAIDFS